MHLATSPLAIRIPPTATLSTVERVTIRQRSARAGHTDVAGPVHPLVVLIVQAVDYTALIDVVRHPRVARGDPNAIGELRSD